MTSAPSLRLPSSGNSTARLLALLALLIVLTTSACEALKPAVQPDRRDDRRDDRDRTEQPEDTDDGGDLDPIQSRRVYDPTTGTYVYVRNAPTEPMDTVRWTTTDEDRVRPITDEGSAPFLPPTDPGRPGDGENPVTQIGTGLQGSRLLSAYNVNLSLPFLTDRYLGSEDDIDPNSEWALHYYAGARMALDELRNGDDGRFNVRVNDTQAKAAKVQQLITDQDFQTANVVIGPYLRDHVSLMAEAVRGKETVLVSPYSAATGISQNNPNYVQVNPTLETHLRNLMAHVMTTQRADRIVLVGTGDQREAGRMAILQEEYLIQKNDANALPLEVLNLDINSPGENVGDYLNGRKTVFVVPIYEDESFVANFLRLAYNASRDDFGRNIAVYGLPQWMDFKRIDLDYYEGTNVHVTSSVFIDPLDPAVRQFKRDYFARFAVLPRNEAYVGYDVTRYFLRMASQYGTRFQYALPDNPERLLHTRFAFEPVMATLRESMGMENAQLQRFENKFVNILQFRDYAFRRVN